MKTTADFLDALRVKLNLPSDGRLADHLGMHRQHISRYRTLNGTFDDETAMRIADILETDPAYVVACMHAQRAKRTEEKKLWERIATSMAGIAAVLALVAILPSATLPSWDGFNAALHGLSSFDKSHYYASGIYIIRIAAGYWWALLPLALLLYAVRPQADPCIERDNYNGHGHYL